MFLTPVWQCKTTNVLFVRTPCTLWKSWCWHASCNVCYVYVRLTVDWCWWTEQSCSHYWSLQCWHLTLCRSRCVISLCHWWIHDLMFFFRDSRVVAYDPRKLNIFKNISKIQSWTLSVTTKFRFVQSWTLAVATSWHGHGHGWLTQTGRQVPGVGQGRAACQQLVWWQHCSGAETPGAG